MNGARNRAPCSAPRLRAGVGYRSVWGVDRVRASPVGRAGEIEELERFVAGLADGLTSLALMGPPGVGKTTVWEAGVDLARDARCHVLAARPSGAEASFAFAGLADLLRDVDAALFDELPAPQRRALDVALLREDPGRRGGEPHVVATATLRLLRALASERPTVVAVDDAQWLDRPTADALRFAVRRLAAVPLGVLTSVRVEDGGRPDTFERALPPDRQRDLTLSPLSIAALHDVIRLRLDWSPRRPVIVRIAESAAGNAYYAIEIARELRRGEGDPRASELPVPPTLQALVRERVRCLPSSAREALLLATALAVPTTTIVPAADLAAAEDDGLVRIDPDGRIRFEHPLVAAAVYESSSRTRRQRAHRQLAEQVEDREERARHLALAADAHDHALVDDLRAAASHARARGAPASAAQLTELALRLAAPESRTAAELRVELAEHLYWASDFPRAHALLAELRATLPPGDLRARALLTLAQIDYWQDGETAALMLAEQALADAADPLQQARCQTDIAMYAGTVDVEHAAHAAHAALALLDGRADADPAVTAAALASQVRARLFLGNGLDRSSAARALELEGEAPPIAVDNRVTFRLGQWLRYVDDFGASRSHLQEAERQAAEEGDESSEANILLNRVILETWAGQWVQAAELTRRMADAFERQGVDSEGIAPWRVYLDAYAGRLGAVNAAVGPRSAEPVIGAIWSRCVGLAELAAGDPDAAANHLITAVEVFDDVDFREPAIWRVEGDAIEAAIVTGRVDWAERRLTAFEAHAKGSSIPWNHTVSRRCRGLLRAMTGELEDAALTLEQVLADDRCPMPIERGRTLLLYGRILRRRKQKRQARVALEDAVAVFARLGADTWMMSAGEELGRVAVRRAPVELSPTELRIASLAASGLSNPEIATQVFVSRKTVEANLARAYRKLGISSRAQLGRALDRIS
jgi:DNA-binding CsgD family transcriptional regulator